MMILMGMLGFAAALAVFCVGWRLGGKHKPERALPLREDAQERQRLQAEQAAFHQLLQYSPETAYADGPAEGGD